MCARCRFRGLLRLQALRELHISLPQAHSEVGSTPPGICVDLNTRAVLQLLPPVVQTVHNIFFHVQVIYTKRDAGNAL
jgi:hypothetical protein